MISRGEFLKSAPALALLGINLEGEGPTAEKLAGAVFSLMERFRDTMIEAYTFVDEDGTRRLKMIEAGHFSLPVLAVNPPAVPAKMEIEAEGVKLSVEITTADVWGWLQDAGVVLEATAKAEGSA